jgi:hypothetical protein
MRGVEAEHPGISVGRYRLYQGGGYFLSEDQEENQDSYSSEPICASSVYFLGELQTLIVVCSFEKWRVTQPGEFRNMHVSGGGSAQGKGNQVLSSTQ